MSGASDKEEKQADFQTNLFRFLSKVFSLVLLLVDRATGGGESREVSSTLAKFPFRLGGAETAPTGREKWHRLLILNRRMIWWNGQKEL